MNGLSSLALILVCCTPVVLAVYAVWRLHEDALRTLHQMQEGE